MNLEEQTGLTANDIEQIVQAARRQPEIRGLVLFGSRAKGNYRKGSDVDLAVKGDGVGYNCVTNLAQQLNEETLLPYQFDVLDYNALTNPALKAHIDRRGVNLYSNA
ncbi:nucleotidyltransferase domain-containing protein [Halomonas sp. LS-001]